MARKKAEHPMQPIAFDRSGVVRFQENRIVRDLLDYATPRGFGLNEIACRRDYSVQDREQLAQLIGYSVSGFGDLHEMRRKTVRTADAIADALPRPRAKRVAAKRAAPLLADARHIDCDCAECLPPTF